MRAARLVSLAGLPYSKIGDIGFSSYHLYQPAQVMFPIFFIRFIPQERFLRVFPSFPVV